ncbi:MAG: LacI family transcriptional regulator [Clostridiales bacterium]|nr:LacI family transcriptional regulator [Clostridiales bacterium]
MSDISMRQLAEILGVSVASVSVALRGRSGISEETRARILEEARKRGYDMSRLSSPPVKGLIEVIDFSYHKSGTTIDQFAYYSQLLEAIGSRLSDEGYEMSGPYNPGEASFSSRPKALGAILIGSMISDDELQRFAKSKVPFVVAGNPMTHTPVNSVSHDNVGGITAAVDHLLSYGHTRIGYIKLTGGAIGDERYRTFEQALSAKGLTPACLWDFSDRYSPSRLPELSDLAAKLGGDPYPGTAAICDEDMIAIMFMRLMRDKGFIPGKDISVIGYDDVPVAALMEPPLTTVRTFEPQLGTSAVELLLSCIANPHFQYRHVYIGTELIVRGSTGPVSGK